MATEYCAWPDGCSRYFNYADQAERLLKINQLNWRRYPEAPASMGADRYICERHGRMREEQIWQEVERKGGEQEPPP